MRVVLLTGRLRRLLATTLTVQVKLCDFGFARTMSTKTIMLTSIKGVLSLLVLHLSRRRL